MFDFLLNEFHCLHKPFLPQERSHKSQYLIFVHGKFSFRSASSMLCEYLEFDFIRSGINLLGFRFSALIILVPSRQGFRPINDSTVHQFLELEFHRSNKTRDPRCPQDKSRYPNHDAFFFSLVIQNMSRVDQENDIQNIKSINGIEIFLKIQKNNYS